jgi:hypothetical protein
MRVSACVGVSACECVLVRETKKVTDSVGVCAHL